LQQRLSLRPFSYTVLLRTWQWLAGYALSLSLSLSHTQLVWLSQYTQTNSVLNLCGHGDGVIVEDIRKTTESQIQIQTEKNCESNKTATHNHSKTVTGSRL